MPRKKRQSRPPPRRGAANAPTDQGFYTPFADLDQQLADSKDREQEPVRPEVAGEQPAVERPRPVPDDEAVFLEAMADVAPLRKGKSGHVGPARAVTQPPRFHLREELEAYCQLADLVNGAGEFDLTWTDEYIEGAVLGISPDVLKKLRNGEFSYQDYTDLHGMNRAQAKDETRRFIRHCFGHGLRCVLIIPGRGLNSEDKVPVLKESLVDWLTHTPLKRMVLAFASARPRDGGLGAVYVLLRHGEKSCPIVPQGR